MTRVLITGVSGLLGLNLALEAAKRYQVTGLWASKPVQASEFESLQTNLLEQAELVAVLEKAKPDWVINCAALANLDACERQPELAQQLNAQMPGRLAAETVKRGMRFLQVSTDAVFDGSKGVYSEENTPSPINVYGRTKRLAELATKSAHPGTIIARVNFVGWSGEGNRSLVEFFYDALSAGETVNGYTDRVFCPLLVTDLATMLLELLEADQPGIYHVVSSDSVTKYDFGVTLAKQFGFDPGLVRASQTPNGSEFAPRSPNLTLSNAKTAKTLGRRLPTVSDAIQRLHAQLQSGYREQLRSMLAEPVKG